jgi:hypothetical protein
MTKAELKEYGEGRQDRMGIYYPQFSDYPLWRYLDLPRFMSMLEESSLFFARADTLGDPFEGAYARGNTQLPEDQKQTLERYFTSVAQHFYVNCWHINQFESAAMWRLYAHREGSVAIQSSTPRLRSVLPHRLDRYGLPKRGHIDIGQIRYLNYDLDRVFEGFTFDAFLHKRKSFDHEKEVRAFFPDPDFPDIPRWEWIVNDVRGPSLCPELSKRDINFPPGSTGIHIRVDLDALVERIYVSPTAPDWLRPLVQSISKRYKLAVPVLQSRLRDTPIF